MVRAVAFGMLPVEKAEQCQSWCMGKGWLVDNGKNYFKLTI